MVLQLKYFAALREELEIAAEAFETEAATVAELLQTLRARGDRYAQVLRPDRPLRVAVNHTMAQSDTPIPAGAEVGIFPPVTGG